MRVFDIILSFIAIVAFLPLGIFISLILKLTGEGEVFYLQERIGLNSKSFFIIKFVTMVKDSPNIGAKDITLKNDPRVLPIGRFLRKTKLNEFPQFINVLIGDMSLVGPRPLVINQFKSIPEEYRIKISILRPGITSLGSIIFRDEEKFLNDIETNSNAFYKDEIVPYKSKIEYWYSKKKNIINDLKILFLTVLSIFSPKNKLHNWLFIGIPRHPIFNPK